MGLLDRLENGSGHWSGSIKSCDVGLIFDRMDPVLWPPKTPARLDRIYYKSSVICLFGLFQETSFLYRNYHKTLQG